MFFLRAKPGEKQYICKFGAIGTLFPIVIFSLSMSVQFAPHNDVVADEGIFSEIAVNFCVNCDVFTDGAEKFFQNFIFFSWSLWSRKKYSLVNFRASARVLTISSVKVSM